MSDEIPAGPPHNALPLREAMRQFLPQEMWDELTVAQEERRKLPKRPVSYSLFVRDDPETRRANDLSNRARRAQSHLEKTWRGMVAHMRQRLMAGELVGYAQDMPPFGQWRPIPPDAWRRLQIKDPARGAVQGANILLADVHILKAEVEPDHAVLINWPGRPRKGTDLIKEEFARRVAAGKIEQESLAEQGRVLLAWFRGEYPRASPPTEGTVRNTIRSAYKGAINKSKANRTKQ